MTDKRQKRAAEFIAPFRVEPGSKVTLAKDFDPAFKAGVKKKKEGVAAARGGRAAAGRVPGAPGRAGHVGGAGGPAGARCGRQGRDDPPRDERRQPAGRPGAQLQGSLGRGARSRLPLALRAAAARARRDRDLQPLPLRGGARGARAPREPRSPEAPGRGEEGGRVEAALSRDQRLGALPERERVPDREAVPEPLEGGAAPSLPAADRPARPQLEVLRRRRPRAGALGRLPGGVLGGALAHEHRVGAVVRDPGRSQVVRAHRCGGRAGPRPDGDRPSLPGVTKQPARGAARGRSRRSRRRPEGAAPDPFERAAATRTTETPGRRRRVNRRRAGRPDERGRRRHSRWRSQ